MRHTNHSYPRRHKGFTLIELIGVIAILAILASVMAPSIVGTVNDAYATAERENLKQLAEDLEVYISVAKSIPSSSTTDWGPALASISDYPSDQITMNRRGFNRALYFDPQFFSTTNSSFSGYTQTTGLTSRPNSARVMIISDLTSNVSQPAVDGSTFDAIWNQDSDAALIETKTLNIQRLNLSSLFHRVILTNPNPAQTAYALESGAATPVAAASGSTDGVLEIWVLHNSELLTYQSPYPSGDLSTVVLIDESHGHFYIDESGGS